MVSNQLHFALAIAFVFLNCSHESTFKMHLPEESANESVWSALSWEKRDLVSDALPMMDSFLWPLGKCEATKILIYNAM